VAPWREMVVEGLRKKVVEEGNDGGRVVDLA
jgi:hypothetical protein